MGCFFSSLCRKCHVTSSLLFPFSFYSQHQSKGPLMIKLAMTIRNEILEEQNSGDGFCLHHRVALEALSGT